ncbi:unnamed protein product [Linum trigynum]|uniref:Retroviral polymerase SH3-like domain-containing protein n=1 Tax=Linum trigynum TaxID=586398 RepID=A0AAV2FEA3_9ROSI
MHHHCCSYLINRMPLTSIKNQTPFEVLLSRTPKYDYLRTFGCLVYPKDTRSHLSKFAARGKPGIFVSYPAQQRGYRVFDIDSRMIYTSRDVFFLEKVFPFRNITPVSNSQPLQSSSSWLHHDDDDEQAYDTDLFDMVQAATASLDNSDVPNEPAQSPSSPSTEPGETSPTSSGSSSLDKTYSLSSDLSNPTS